MATVIQEGGNSTLQREIRGKAERVKDSVNRSVSSVADAAETVVTEANAYVKQRPWTSIAIASGVVLMVGMLLGRRH